MKSTMLCVTAVLGLALAAGGCGGPVYRVVSIKGAVAKHAGVYQVTPLQYTLQQSWEPPDVWSKRVRDWDKAFRLELARHLPANRLKFLGAGQAPGSGVVITPTVFKILRFNTGINNKADRIHCRATVRDTASNAVVAEIVLDVDSERFSPLSHTFGGRMELAAMNFAETLGKMLINPPRGGGAAPAPAAPAAKPPAAPAPQPVAAAPAPRPAAPAPAAAAPAGTKKPDPDKWYYGLEGKRHGPITTRQIHAMVPGGKLGPNTLVWRYGMRDWSRVKGVAELTSASAK